MRLTSSLIVVALLPALAFAQGPATARAGGASVSGVVHDSISRVPLAGATVQLVAADSMARFTSTTTSDSAGRFALEDVPDGRYRIGFFHPILDSLGVAPPLREVAVAGGRAVRADLAVPSPARLRAAICGTKASADSGAVVIGVVRDARDGTPVAGVNVSGEWLEVTFTQGAVARRAPRIVATTADNGWFALCNVPRSGTMFVGASRGSDSTDLIELQIPADRFMRRELFLGAARRTESSGGRDEVRRDDSLTALIRRVHFGDGRISGTVVGVAGGRPLAGAVVGLVNGPQTRANERGEWTLVDAPAGTRMLEVRALGYYPERHRVDVIASAPPVQLSLSTLRTVLDTIRVSATRIVYDRDRSGFQARRRTGPGRYLTPKDILRLASFNTSDALRMVPGVHVDRQGLDTHISMRGAFGRCSPTIFLDGMQIDRLSGADIDNWVSPEQVAGIEIYSDVTAPGEFKDHYRMEGCGSIVIWSK